MKDKKQTPRGSGSSDKMAALTYGLVMYIFTLV